VNSVYSHTNIDNILKTIDNKLSIKTITKVTNFDCSLDANVDSTDE